MVGTMSGAFEGGYWYALKSDIPYPPSQPLDVEEFEKLNPQI